MQMLFCNEFSICKIYTENPIWEIPQPWYQEFNSWKLIGFSISKAQENPF